MRTERVSRQEGDEKSKVPNLQWIIRAHFGERAWGLRGFRTSRRPLDHRHLRSGAGIISALALLGQSPSIVSSSDLVKGESLVLALPAPPRKFILLALQAQPREEVTIAENLTGRSEVDAQRKKLGGV
jgi:hypothetical protein